MFETLIRNALRHTTFARRRASSEALASARTALAKPRPVLVADSLKTSVPAASRLSNKPTAAELAVMTAPTSHNRVSFHVDAVASQAALLDSIRTAKKSFYIETFIWHNDAAGNEVIRALADRVAQAKARGQHFDARVLIDWLGLTQGTGATGDPQIVDKLRRAGVKVIEFSPGWITDGHIAPITHRKLYIKDGSSFISGGRNIGDEYLHANFVDASGQTTTSWHDLMYTVEGNETGRVIDQFFKNWQRAGGKLPRQKPPIVPAATGHARVQTFVTDPILGIHDLQAAQLGLIAHARHEIVLSYPYFSDDRLIAALVAAKRANPKLSIKVMLPASREASAEGGVFSVLNRESARALVSAGIEVRMFTGGVIRGQEVDRFSHFKSMLIDGKVLSIGSANADHRTFNNNHELINVIADAAAARDFRAQVVTPDWASSRPLTAADLAQDSWWLRLKEWALKTFSFLL